MWLTRRWTMSKSFALVLSVGATSTMLKVGGRRTYGTHEIIIKNWMVNLGLDLEIFFMKCKSKN